MIRSVGPAGPLKVVGLVAWQLRFDLLAVLIVAAAMVPIPDTIQIDSSAALLSVLGLGASIFLGLNRWWEARTQWGAIISDCRAWHNGLSSIDDGSATMAPILDRLRRRQVRHAWQLTAELRRVPLLPGVTALTPEDPADAGATDLLHRQADDVQILSAGGHLDDPARVMLMSVNSGLVATQGALERIRNQPSPVQQEMLVRALAWFLGILAFNRLDASSENPVSIVMGVLVMALFVVVERLSHFVEEPMNNRIFDLPLYRFCSTVTGDLLGAGHPLAQPRETARAAVWM